MPTARAPEPTAGRQHVAHFYGNDEELVVRATEYLATGLRDGCAVILIATDAHRRAFEECLQARGLVLDRNYAAVDAAATIDRFVDEGEVDPQRFQAAISDLVQRAAPDGEPVRTYGEMVALLWAGGAVNAALEVERLWADVCDRTGMGVFCGYPAQEVDVDTQHEALLEVCGMHAATYGSAPWLPYWDDPSSVSVRFTPSLSAPATARRFAADALRDWGDASMAEDAALVVSELASNAVLHARSPFTLKVRREGDVVTLSVTDESPQLPVARAPKAGDANGRGLRMVAAVSATWGARAAGSGKTVWAELVAPRRTPGGLGAQRRHHGGHGRR